MIENFKGKPIMRKRVVSSSGSSVMSDNETTNENNLPTASDSHANESGSLKEKLEKVNLSGYYEQERKARNVRASKYRTDTTSFLIDLALEKASLDVEWFLMLETNHELRTKHRLKNSQISGHLYAKLNQGFVENRELNDEELAVFDEAGISPGNMKAWRVTDDFRERMKRIREQIEADDANESNVSQDSVSSMSDIKEGETDEASTSSTDE